MKNASGNYVPPSIATATAALIGVKLNPDLTYNPINTKNKTGYAITSPTWLMVYQTQPNAAIGNAVKAFLTFIEDNSTKLRARRELRADPALVPEGRPVGDRQDPGRLSARHGGVGSFPRPPPPCQHLHAPNCEPMATETLAPPSPQSLSEGKPPPGRATDRVFRILAFAAGLLVLVILVLIVVTTIAKARPGSGPRASARSSAPNWDPANAALRGAGVLLRHAARLGDRAGLRGADQHRDRALRHRGLAPGGSGARS